MKRLLLISSLFFVIPVSAAEITSKIVDSVQLTVQGAAIQTQRMGSSYTLSGSNISVGTMGSASSSGTYTVTNPGQAFSLSESKQTADVDGSVTRTITAGQFVAPDVYSNSTTQMGGDKGTLAGTLSATGVPTVTAGGPGTTATGQRTIELSVFK